MDVKKIKEHAVLVRNSFDKLYPELGIGFENFPLGSCGDATLILGTYLIENGFGQFQDMCGGHGDRSSPNWSSHAWLQQGDIVVDITADQFAEIEATVIVAVGWI